MPYFYGLWLQLTMAKYKPAVIAWRMMFALLAFLLKKRKNPIIANKVTHVPVKVA